MIGVMIIPTGIGCEIGGHAGDANPAMRVLAAACDTLIVHPNVVNASDINEMPDNCLYVEGSMLDRFLEGHISLRPVKSNRILVVANRPLRNETINAVSASRYTLGLDADILELETQLRMRGYIENNQARGNIHGWVELVNQVREYQSRYDALAIVTPIEVNKEVALKYFNDGTGINPWGGVEAQLSKLVADSLSIPVAHAPIDSGAFTDYDEVVDPRQAAEHISKCYLHSVLKGLHRAPRIEREATKSSLSVGDVDVLISPMGLWGTPHEACKEAGIPIIEVEENKTRLPAAKAHRIYQQISDMPGNFIIASDYLQAAGIILAMKKGVSLETVRRTGMSPVKVRPTTVIRTVASVQELVKEIT